MNETQRMLAAAVERLFGDRLGWDVLTRIEEQGFPRQLWDDICAQGVHKVLADESSGGLGATWSDAYPVWRACGRHALPLPLPEAMICEWLARCAGVRLPNGVPGLLGTPLPARGGDHVELMQVVVPWGHSADFLVALAPRGATTELLLLDAAGCTIEREDNIGRDARDRLSGPARVLAHHAIAEATDCVWWLGALARSAQIAGAGGAALDLALKYCAERSQFGRPLAAFQAIQHYLAEVAGIVAAVDSIGRAACANLDARGMAARGRSARLEIAAAKCRASEAVEKLTRLTHQVHGAIGFTYEYGLHFLTRRLWAWRAEFGGAGYWGEYLGRIAVESGGDGVWATLTG